MLNGVSCHFGLFVVLSISCLCVWGENDSSPIQQCSGETVKDLRQRIQVEPCGKKICKLVRGSNSTVTIKFKPDTKVQTLVNEVYADIQGISLPFVGVTGTNACKDVLRGNTGEKVSCPLAANEEYVYKVVFHVEEYYPPISVRVHWSLNSGNRTLICFELPAVIK